MNRTMWMLVVVALGFAASPSRAHFWEVGLEVNEGGLCVSRQITIRNVGTNAVVGTYSSSSTCAGAPPRNFTIDLRENVADGPDSDPSLEGWKDHLLEIHFNSGKKLFLLEPTPMPCEDEDGSVNNDVIYRVTPAGATRTYGLASCHRVSVTSPPEPDPLTLSLSVFNCEVIGVKTTFDLSAFATGGDGSYLFTWDWAQPLTTATANPNRATRTDSSPFTIDVTVESDGGSTTRSITLDPASDCEPL